MSDTYCSRCGRLITFVRTERGAKMPCNAARVDFIEDVQGDAFVYLSDGVSARGWIVQSRCDDSVKAYRPHWASCSASVHERSKVRSGGARVVPGLLRGSAPSAVKAEVAARGDGGSRAGRPGKRVAGVSEGGDASVSADARVVAHALESYEQLSLFPAPRTKLKERCSAFDV